MQWQRQRASPRKNVLVATAFQQVEEKQWFMYGLYNNDFTLEDCLSACKSNQEKLAVLVLDGIKQPGRSSNNFKIAYEIAPMPRKHFSY